MNRRNYLRTIGGIAGATAIGGAGLAAISGSGAAMSVNIPARPVSVSTDHGEIDRVWIQPNISGEFEGFDEVVGKVRILIEASPNDVESGEVGNFAPVFRATMWLNGTNDPGIEIEEGPGYTGNFAAANEWFGGSDGITLYDREGPDYGTLENAESFFDGTSIGQDIPESGYENGSYEQAGTVNRFFNDEDGTTEPTTVTLRYTISLHAPNSSIAEDYDIPEEDVSETSTLVMADADDVDSPISNYDADVIPYSVLQDHPDHPAIGVHTTTFDVSVENQPSEADSEGDSNTGASGEDEIEEENGDDNENNGNGPPENAPPTTTPS